MSPCLVIIIIIIRAEKSLTCCNEVAGTSRKQRETADIAGILIRRVTNIVRTYLCQFQSLL